MARVLVTRRLPGDALKRLAADHDVEIWEHARPLSAEELRERAEGLDGLITMLDDRVDADLLAAAPDLRAIANYAVGSDNIDLEGAEERGIVVGITPDVLTEATADLAWALALAVVRRLPEAAAAVREGSWRTWEPRGWLGGELQGRELGIVGYGRIGQAVARRGEGFGMHVLHTGDLELDEILGRADVLSLHVPLTDDTRRLIDRGALQAMKPTAVLVNTARGPIVDTDALVSALEAGDIAGAGLDVTDPEPLPPDHPLLSAPNVLVVPHIGSATRDTRARMADIAVDNLLAGLAGEPMPHPAR